MYLTKVKLRQLLQSGIHKFYITKHENISSIPLDLFWDELVITEQKAIIYKNFTELDTFTNRTGLVSIGKASNHITAKRPCFIPLSTLIITSKGKVLPCYEDYDQKSEMGDLTRNSLSEIWHQEQYIKFREDLKKGYRFNYESCKNCNNQMLF